MREARDADAGQLVRLIGDVFAEYPGCVLDVENEEPELLGVASAYAKRGGQFWVVAQGERIIASVGWVPVDAAGSQLSQSRGPAVELKKLYVEKVCRRRGIARQCCERVEAIACDRGAVRIVLWSDTRFVEAHAFYVSQGYAFTGQTRELFDLSSTREYEFVKQLE